MTRTSERAPRLPLRVVDFGTGQAALRRMRDETAPLSELIYDGPGDRFAARISSYEMRSAVLLEASVPRLMYDRSPRHVARSGFDYYLVVVYLRGESRQPSGARELVIGPGDIGVLDQTYPVRTRVEPARDDPTARHITLILPRALLASLLPTSGTISPQRIPGDQPYGRILRGLLLDLWRNAAQLSPAETEPLIRAVATLVAAGMPGARNDVPGVAAAAHAATRAAIQHLLDRPETQASELGVTALCRRFHVSRATLYRMFEAEGGLIRYVRQHQLRRALEVITSPAHRHHKIIDIALQHGFITESGFIRAFCRRFGVTPGEARAEPSSVLVEMRAAARRSGT